MKKSLMKNLVTIFIVLFFIVFETNVYAHSGRTDSNGGHKDKKNVSGLGAYHYHCGGYPAHLHENGVCPYSSDYEDVEEDEPEEPEEEIYEVEVVSEEVTQNDEIVVEEDVVSNDLPSKPEENETVLTETITTNEEVVMVTPEVTPEVIEVESVEINEKVGNFKVGESKILSVTIKPDNVTDKSITWNSSDNNIVSIDNEGKITANKSGIAEITAKSNNGKSCTIKIQVEEENTQIINESKTSENILTDTQNEVENAEDKEESSAGRYINVSMDCWWSIFGN